MNDKELRLCTKLGLLVQKRRAQRQHAAESGDTSEGGLGADELGADGLGAAALWSEIVARTDELYSISEVMQPAFRRVCRAIFDDCGQSMDERYGKYAAFTDGGLR